MSLLAIKGTYQNGLVILDEQIATQKPVAVIVTFLEEQAVESTIKLFSSFNFKKSQLLSSNLKGSLTDALVEERREL